MKTEKTSAATAKNKAGNKSNGSNKRNENSTAPKSGKTAATGKIRSSAGRGLRDEGTSTSYENEDRNGPAF